MRGIMAIVAAGQREVRDAILLNKTSASISGTDRG